MYKREQNQVLDLLQTILEAINYARKNKDQAITYIQDSLFAIHEIFEFITTVAPDCDAQYFYKDKVIESLDKAEAAQDIPELGRWLRQSQKQISKLIHIIEEFPVKRQILFLPYKAAMWTAFDSIWKAAIKDNTCEVVVMPIPYFELDKMRQPHKHCYEAEEFPAYVPITHFTAYDIETEKPDMIFIHNPYDDINTLTMVEPKYFSRNLKHHTQILVYSPYYTLRLYNPKKGIFLCVAPATQHAHKILIQSERLKEIYIELGHKPDKLLALGSPKIDAVVEKIKNPPEIPIAWVPKIANRTVFLINTHFSFFSKFGDKAFYMMDNVIEYFIKHKECAAIWRPHPFTETILETRFPQLMGAYQRLIKRLDAAENGIIDRYPDYAYAFSVSKAMFSTYSSLVTEFMVTGHPVYIMERKNKDEINKISPVNYGLNYYYEKDRYNGVSFVEMVLRDEDPLYDERMQMMEHAFLNSKDGSSGEKIYQHLLKDLV